MAIRMMVSEPGPGIEIVEDYPGSETWRIYHDYNCPHKNSADHLKQKGPDCTDRCVNYRPLYMQTSYVGCVLDTYEVNGRDDSDFYAVVWDEESQQTKTIQYATTRGWTYPNGANIDATEEVKAKAQEYLRKKYIERRQEDAKREAEMPLKGRIVKVIAGRKIPQGVVGEVLWFGEDQYKASARRRYNRYNPYADLVNRFYTGDKRIRLKWTDETGEHKEFTAADNVQVVNPENYIEPIPTITSELPYRGLY